MSYVGKTLKYDLFFTVKGRKSISSSEEKGDFYPHINEDLINKINSYDSIERFIFDEVFIEGKNGNERYEGHEPR